MDPSGTDTMTGGAPPGDSASAGSLGTTCDDRALLDSALAAMLDGNRAHAIRLDAVSRFHANRVAEAEVGGSDSPRFFVLTPLQATKVEFAPLLGISELYLQLDLDLTDGLKRWFPGVWRRCLEGRLDIGRARLLFDQLNNLTSDIDKAAYAELMEAYFDQMDDPAAPLYPVSRATLQRAARRRCLKFPQKDEQSSFGEAFKKRRVSIESDENGMAFLTATTAVHEALTADHRLTLIAKKLKQAEGETRTLQQLRVDALFDLIHGRLAVGATVGELEDDRTSDDDDPATTFDRKESVGGYARPVINVTVPITTLMGMSDEPGTLAGGTSIPAELARQIAMDPGATWYRLLTDRRGRFVELSTNSYTPSPPICRWVVARDRECIWPGCCRPATVIELDHRVSFPLGATSTLNLQPLCRRHHLVKHSEGFSVVREADGSYTWTSRFGSTFRKPAPEYPVVDLQREVDAEFESLMEREFSALIGQ